MLGAGPSRALYPRPIFTNKFHLSSLHSYQTSRDIRSESRATRTPCHPIAPTSSSRRLRERESQSYSNCHLPNVITFQLSSAPRPFSSGTDQRSVRHHVTESSQRRWKEFRFCPWHGALWLPIAAGRDYL